MKNFIRPSDAPVWLLIFLWSLVELLGLISPFSPISPMLRLLGAFLIGCTAAVWASAGMIGDRAIRLDYMALLALGATLVSLGFYRKHEFYQDLEAQLIRVRSAVYNGEAPDTHMISVHFRIDPKADKEALRQIIASRSFVETQDRWWDPTMKPPKKCTAGQLPDWRPEMIALCDTIDGIQVVGLYEYHLARADHGPEAALELTSSVKNTEKYQRQLMVGEELEKEFRARGISFQRLSPVIVTREELLASSQ